MSSLYKVIGLMSGTSADGIDAVYLQTDGERVTVLGSASVSYELIFHHLLKAAMRAVAAYRGDLEKANQDFKAYFLSYCEEELRISFELTQEFLRQADDYLHQAGYKTISLKAVIDHSTRLHAQCVNRLMNQLQIRVDAVDVIGYHGQTLYHEPPRISVQAGDPTLLSALTHCKVVGHFRQNDLKHGGQGAPLAPIYHQLRAVQAGILPTAVINCGGIANITLINGERLEDILASYDCGPGNVLLDQCVREYTQGKESMDRDGRYGLEGAIDEYVFQQLRASSCLKEGKNYYDLPAPKSLDSRDLVLIPELRRLSLPDACATLADFSAAMMIEGLVAEAWKPTYIVLAGGGWKNPLLRQRFDDRIRQVFGNNELTIALADEIGWCSQTLEAELMAVLAVRCLLNQPSTGPNITGSSEYVVVGELTS